jgi:hypothetical protein
MGTLAADVARQNGRKVLWVAISYTTAAGVTTLPATCAEDGSTPPKDATVILQPSTDVCYRFVKSTTATPGATTSNACKVLADQQEGTRRTLGDVAMDVIGVSASGTLKVFLLLPGVG